MPAWQPFHARTLDLDLQAHTSIRFGIGRFTTEAEVDHAVGLTVQHVNKVTVATRQELMLTEWVIDVMPLLFKHAVERDVAALGTRAGVLASAPNRSTLQQIDLAVVFFHSLRGAGRGGPKDDPVEPALNLPPCLRFAAPRRHLMRRGTGGGGLLARHSNSSSERCAALFELPGAASR